MRENLAASKRIATAGRSHLCADMQGFTLNAAVRCDADERQVLEQCAGHAARIRC